MGEGSAALVGLARAAAVRRLRPCRPRGEVRGLMPCAGGCWQHHPPHPPLTPAFLWPLLLLAAAASAAPAAAAAAAALVVLHENAAHGA